MSRLSVRGLHLSVIPGDSGFWVAKNGLKKRAGKRKNVKSERAQVKIMRVPLLMYALSIRSLSGVARPKKRREKETGED